MTRCTSLAAVLLFASLANAQEVNRRISTPNYSAGVQVDISLTAVGFSADATVTETIPEGFSVTDDGGGTENDSELSFDITGVDADRAFFSDVVREGTGVTGTSPVIQAGGLLDSVPLYNDRNHVWANIAGSSVENASWIQVSNSDKGVGDYRLTVTADADTMLILAIDHRMGDNSRGTPPDLTNVMTWVEDMGFESTGEVIGIDEGNDGSVNQDFTLYAMEIPGEEPIELLEQNDGGGRNMYLPIIPAGAPPVVFRYGITAEDCEGGTVSSIDGVVAPGDLAVGGDQFLNCLGECGLYASGGISSALILGPVDLGRPAGQQCDDQGAVATTDYLKSEDTGDETSVLVNEGDTVFPDFGDEAGGIGVAFSINPDINPDAPDGLTAWSATADETGYIDYERPENIDALDDYLVYALVYITNNTGDCRDAVLELGSDDAVKARLNGRLVHVNSVCRGIGGYGGGDRVPVTFAPGTNVLLVATIERGGGSGVRIVVRDTDDSPLLGGDVVAGCEAPDDYPSSAGPPSVTRSLSEGVVNNDGEVTITLSATGVFGSATITEAFDASFTVTDAGGCTVQDNTITFEVTSDGDVSYTLIAADPCPDGDLARFVGEATIAEGCPNSAAVMGPDAIRCATGCPAPPDAADADLVWAFRFASAGTPLFEIETPNDAGFFYENVLQGTVQDLVYDEDLREYGYEQVYTDGFDGRDDLPLPVHTGRGGWEIFGPFDESPNLRQAFTDTEPEEIYDGFIGAKNFLNQTGCTATINDPPDRNVPCAEGNLAPLDPDGIIFRADVPNGLYRFVAALGSADNPHAHRLVAEDGGEGPPTEIGPNHVVLVSNHDQAEFTIGEVDANRPGEGVFARVGFEGKLPPMGDGVFPDPQFINMDVDGLPTNGCPESPVLEVTQGYIRFHQLQANSNPPGNDVNGGDFVLLEIWCVGEIDPPDGVRFVRGDADSSGSINLTDGVAVLNYLFLGGAAPSCLDAGDFDDSGGVDLAISDAIGVFNWLFLGGDGPAPPAPAQAAITESDCGVDPTPDDGIECEVASPVCG